MKRFFNICRLGAHHGSRAVLAMTLWTFWLLLVLLLAAQIWCVTSRELAVPGFVLRALEERLAASQLRATFGRTQFDPSGRILVENVNLYAASFQEPLVTVRAVYARLDPWALLAGRFEPLEFRVSGVSLFVPAMLSASGRAEPLLNDLDAIIVPGESEVTIPLLTARLAGLTIAARGTVHTALWRHERGAPLPIADAIARDFPRIGREIAAYETRLAQLQEPQLELELSPSLTRGAIVTATLYARGLDLAGPFALKAANLSAHTRFPVAGETSVRTQIDVSADELDLAGPHPATARNVAARLRFTFHPEQHTVDSEDLTATARRVVAGDFTAEPFAVKASRRNGPVSGEVTAQLSGAPVTAAGDVDLVRNSAGFGLEIRPTAALLAALSPLAHLDLPAVFTFARPPQLNARVVLDPGWKFAGLDAHVAAQGVVAKDVPLEDISGHVTLSGADFRATDIVAHQGANEARGSYLGNLATGDFRFLLTGRLRPAGIDGWFTEWWPRIFQGFDFTAAPPSADVDVQGRWSVPDLTTVFISVDAVSPVIRTVPFDRASTRLFIRSDTFIDALDFSARRGAGSASGTFTRRTESATNDLRAMDVALTSTIDLQDAARMFGPDGRDIVSPFHFATPPLVRLNGHFDGPAAPGGVHKQLHLEAESTGAFTLFDFPLENLSFSGNLRDDDLNLDRVKIDFAGGSAQGKVHLSGGDADRRLEFDLGLKGANLARIINTLEDFSSGPEPAGTGARSNFMEKAADVRLNLALAASGRYGNPLSFQGQGHADLSGPELGQVRMLGLLSELLSFTSLRFTQLDTDFQIDGRKLVFPEGHLKLTGANSVLEANGTYALDQKQLDFNAKVFPLGKSRFLLPQVFNMVLTPLSEILEVKLSGTLEKPKWVFAHGPTNFLRNLAPTAGPQGPDKTAASPAAAGPASAPVPPGTQSNP